MNEWLDVNAWIARTQIAANLATTVGVIGLFIGYRQLRNSQRSQREATALGIWKDYLQLAMNNPTLSLRQPTAVGANAEHYEQYEWFVASMLFACEQILALEPDDPSWLSTIEAQLSYHRLHLAGADFEPRHYSDALQALIDRVKTDPPRGRAA